MTQPRILGLIVFAQFCCTSLWFASNGIIGELSLAFNLQQDALGHLTSAVQFGFIIGTFVFALFNLADRIAPSKLFFASALIAAFMNAAMIWNGNNFFSLLIFRFFTGFFLAGIYPVGMKIAADYFQQGLGKSLGLLVGALVLGTAFPHALAALGAAFAWEKVLLSTSFLATLGGLLMLVLVPDGPYRKAAQKLKLSAFFDVFRNKAFRGAAFGYFGHMWELYTFWAFVPVMLLGYAEIHAITHLNSSLLAFFIIALGSISCVGAGFLSTTFGEKRIASIALGLSGLSCFLSPLFFLYAPLAFFIGFLCFWGVVVIADSPMFSSLVAQNAPKALKGTALTTVNGIGFGITIVSIQLLGYLSDIAPDFALYTTLGFGPVLGLVALKKWA